MKNRLLLTIFITVTLLACNKEKFHSHRLYAGEGRWKIESLEIQVFDSTGTLVKDSSVNDLGEIVFFKGESLDALFEYRLATWLYKDTAGTHTNTFQYLFDGERIHLDQPSNSGYKGDISPIAGLYTSEVDKKRKQVWVQTSIGNFPDTKTSLGSKTIMTLKKE